MMCVFIAIWGYNIFSGMISIYDVVRLSATTTSMENT